MSAFRLIAAEKADHSISLLCEILGVSRSGYHAWARRAPSGRQLTDAWLLELEIHQVNRGVYGAPGSRRAQDGPEHPRRAQARRATHDGRRALRAHSQEARQDDDPGSRGSRR